MRKHGPSTLLRAKVKYVLRTMMNQPVRSDAFLTLLLTDGMQRIPYPASRRKLSRRQHKTSRGGAQHFHNACTGGGAGQQ